MSHHKCEKEMNKTCGTCKYRGKEITLNDFDKVKPTGYFYCELIKMPEWNKFPRGKSALVVDGSGYYAALCVETDFGCVKWEAK